MDDTTVTKQIAGSRSVLRPAMPWLVGMLALGVVAVVTGVVRADQLPDPYPVHFGLAGDPDRFTDRSLGAILMPAVVGQICGMSAFATLLLLKPEQRRLVTPLSALAFVVGGGIALTSFAQYLSDDAVAPPWAFWALLGAIAVTTVWLVVTAVRAGRESDADHEGWILGGLFYANPDDPDVFVPYRAGTGVTVNFGHARGWLVMGLILLPVIIIVIGVSMWT